MKKEKVALLLGYFEEQKRIIDNLYKELQEAQFDNKKDTVYAGFLMHNLYSALEELMEEVAKTFENTVEDIAKYHRELLKRMLINVYRIRPALWSEETFKLLDEMRGFRHIFRHSYGYDLDKEKVTILRNKILSNWNKVEEDLERFQNFLKSLL
ncbi:hypothetical protein TAGGR_19 [Thermodesulfovibrio aggregans]|uniref:HepT-like domain-containing protein n=1 Tax=Thermodesulfovibrio aggregans TaxID=86166 RepID=A0A0U9HW83_9BACT|nr:hypothetical protein [Thermodesulfovibrio aggregans]GAQ93845.1 hypothetical protein TAGGR_19 [Thermodesulfovibrio aggregans]